MTSNISLAGEFPVVEHDQWVRQAAIALGRDLETGDDRQHVLDRLRSVTYDGIVIEPLYTAEPNGARTGLPGFNPFVRGRTAAGTRANGWDVRQIVDATATEFKAVAELERGATSLWLDLRGLVTIGIDAIAEALHGVHLDLTSVTLAAGDRFEVAAESLLALWGASGIGGEAASGSFGADPIGNYASNGGTTGVMGQLAAVTDLAGRLTTSHPLVRIVTVDATRFHDAGGSDGQELGFGIAAGVASLRAFESAGLDLANSFRQIELRFAATADQFATIAKFRAARRLWARVAEVAGVQAAAATTPIHAVTSVAMMTRYDPWVNLLRGTMACFGAGIGGADAITVLPYDAVLDPAGSELGRRLARNTQSILSKEANLSRVIDPSGGSWYVETLTEQLAATAWSTFQEIEALGGLIAAVDSGAVAEQIDTTWRARRLNIVTRRDPLTGVSEFPDMTEPSTLANDTVDIAVDGDVSSPKNALARHRYSEPFEVLRERVDRFVAGGNGRPSIFLANIGPPAVHIARATFAKNLFEIAGVIAVVSPGSSDPGELAEQFVISGARAACLCSSDALYEELAADVAAALRQHAPAAVYLAGPGGSIAGGDGSAEIVDGFVTAGVDVEQVLFDLLHRLDVP